MIKRRPHIALACLVVAAAASCGEGGDDDMAETAEMTDVAEIGSEEPISASDGTTPGTVDSGGDDSGGDDSHDDAPEESSVTDAPPPSAGVCSLASDEEISEIVANPVAGVDLDPTLCEYAQSSGDPGVEGTTVDVVVTEAFDDVCSLELDLVGAADDLVIEGLGSPAAWKPSPLTPQLFVCEGSWFVTITQYRSASVTDEEALSSATTIAGLVLARL